MILLIGNEKGGAGKTTIAVNLAAQFAIAGRDVMRVDTDRQESASIWATTRAMGRADRGEPIDMVCVAKTGKVGYDIDRLRAKCDVLIVDAGGQDSSELRQSMAVCDQMLIPVRPSQFDTWSLGKMATLLKDVEDRIGEKIPARVLLNAVSTNPAVREAAELRALLASDYAESFGVMAVQIGERIAYRRATRDGLCVAELTKQYADVNAVEEMRKLQAEVLDV